jgi:SMI1-KNR4 cell-wall
MALDDVLRELRSRNEHVPRPMRLPSAAEVDDAERRLGCKFPAVFRRYLLEASDIVYGSIEPVTITRPEAHTDLFKVADQAWQGYNMPRDLLPICNDNADFYCINAANEIVFWSHNGWSSEKWANLADWIRDVWIGAA